MGAVMWEHTKEQIFESTNWKANTCVHKHESMHTDECFENDGNKEIFGNTHLRAQT